MTQPFLSPSHFTLLQQALDRLQSGFSQLPEFSPAVPDPAMEDVLLRTAERLHHNFPYHHPFYLGQMLKPPHPIAHLAYSLAMCLNPNNHAFDGGRASSLMENECVRQLARMFGWSQHLGHLCSGGTMANFEALWVAREFDRKGVAASSQAHYTHQRLSQVLEIPYYAVPVDHAGRMDLNALEDLLRKYMVSTVVATLGTTGLGAVDPLDRIVELQQHYHFRLHVDAAYGGYFRLAGNLQQSTTSAMAACDRADSLVIDPHKHGLQPYGCGCVLFRDPRVAAFYRHESPYTYYTPSELHLGEISLECSRPGASAVALWATLQLLPLESGGEFATGLEQGRVAALKLHQWVSATPRMVAVNEPELDLVVWLIAARTASRSSQLAQKFFEEAARQDLHLALISLPKSLVQHRLEIEDWDRNDVVCLRACLMKPAHAHWWPEIERRLSLAAQQILPRDE
jgi:glutamate/tyrosine decarboxylase-like PLP-dependent enzyme